MFLGIDIASRNCGHSIISKDGREIRFSKTIVPHDDFCHFDITKLVYQEAFLNKIFCSGLRFSMIAMEAPALAKKFGTFSIGYAHGFFLSYLLKRKVPFVWVPPTKWKYAFLAKGNADKNLGISFVKDFYPKLVNERVDDNQADSLLLALFAFSVFHFVAGSEPIVKNVFGLDIYNRLAEVISSDKTSKNKKEKGILNRPYEFYFFPELELLKNI